MKKVIYVEIDEEITSIFDRAKRAKQKEIYLVVPRKAILFHSAVNLQILKRKLAEIKKKLVIVTTDHTGRHMAERAGIKVYARIEIEENKAPDDDDPEASIQPMTARRNEVSKDDKPTRTEKKVTIRELINDHRIKDRKRKATIEAGGGQFNFVRPNRKFLGLIVAVSVGLFMLITYIALPGATIYIKPKFDNINHSVNITLADKRTNQNILRQNRPNVIASENIDIETKQTKVFNTTSKEFEGTNAKGKIKIINTADEEWPLKGNTRFQTEDGIIFRIESGVVVPPAKLVEVPAAPVVIEPALDEEVVGESEIPEDIPVPEPQLELQNGELIVEVTADPFDIYDDPVGDRGNIGKGIKLSIPGLSKFNQRQIWAVTDEVLKGGTTSYYKIVKEEDIESAERQIEDNLILIAKEDLRTRIDEINKLNHTNLVLLDDRRYVKTELLDLRISDDLEGTRKEKFEVFAKISAQGVAYDFDQLFSLMQKELKTRTHPDMRIRDGSISPDTISYEVIDEDETLGQIKITATIQGIEEFVIDSSEEAGIRFGNKTRDKVLGLPIEEAQNVVANLPEVDDVQIKVWPIWLTSLPRIPENIEIKLLEEEL